MATPEHFARGRGRRARHLHGAVAVRVRLDGEKDRDASRPGTWAHVPEVVGQDGVEVGLEPGGQTLHLVHAIAPAKQGQSRANVGAVYARGGLLLADINPDNALTPGGKHGYLGRSSTTGFIGQWRKSSTARFPDLFDGSLRKGIGMEKA